LHEFQSPYTGTGSREMSNGRPTLGVITPFWCHFGPNIVVFILQDVSGWPLGKNNNNT